MTNATTSYAIMLTPSHRTHLHELLTGAKLCSSKHRKARMMGIGGGLLRTQGACIECLAVSEVDVEGNPVAK